MVLSNDMTEQDYNTEIGRAFATHGTRLRLVISKKLVAVPACRISPDDVLQESFIAATKRSDFIIAHPDVPLYFKLRTIALQTLQDAIRHHIGAQKRSALNEVSLEDFSGKLETVPDELPSPRTILASRERAELLRQVVRELPETDRQILTLRHFDDMSNSECASVLGIDPKAASIRYIRALKRIHEKLISLSEFTS